MGHRFDSILGTNAPIADYAKALRRIGVSCCGAEGSALLMLLAGLCLPVGRTAATANELLELRTGERRLVSELAAALAAPGDDTKLAFVGTENFRAVLRHHGEAFEFWCPNIPPAAPMVLGPDAFAQLHAQWAGIGDMGIGGQGDGGLSLRDL